VTYAESIGIPIEESEASKPPRRKRPPARLTEYLICSTPGGRVEPEELMTFKHIQKRTYFEIIDKFICEMNARFSNKTDMSGGLQAADPSSKFFMNTAEIVKFCNLFPRLNIDTVSIESQIKVAKNMFRSAKASSVNKCYDILLKMNPCFPDLLKFYTIIQCIPTSSASCERSFSSLKRIKSRTRTSTGQTRISDLTLLSVSGT